MFVDLISDYEPIGSVKGYVGSHVWEINSGILVKMLALPQLALLVYVRQQCDIVKKAVSDV